MERRKNHFISHIIRGTSQIQVMMEDTNTIKILPSNTMLQELIICYNNDSEQEPEMWHTDSFSIIIALSLNRKWTQIQNIAIIKWLYMDRNQDWKCVRMRPCGRHEGIVRIEISTNHCQTGSRCVWYVRKPDKLCLFKFTSQNFLIVHDMKSTLKTGTSG